MLMVTGMAVGANQDGRLALVAAASNEESFSGGVWHAWQTAPNDDWSGWHPSTGRTQSSQLFLRVPFTGGLQRLTQTAPNNGWTVREIWPPPVAAPGWTQLRT